MGTNGYIPPRTGRDAKVVLDRSTLRSSLSTVDSIEGGSPAVSGILTALQSLIFGYLIIVVPFLGTSVISTTLVDEAFDFGGTLSVSTKAWVVAHGGSALIGDETFSLIPLGLTVLVLFMAKISVRRSLKLSRTSFATYLGTYVVLVFGVCLSQGVGVSLIAVRALLFTTLLAGGSLWLGIRKNPAAPQLFASVIPDAIRLPGWGVQALRGVAATFFTSLIIGSLAVLAWLYLGRDVMGQVLEQWTLDGLSGFALGLLQVLFFPNLIMWALSWLSGPGFAVGANTIVSPQEVVLGPLPNLPILGALPQTTAPVGFQIVFVVLVVGAGIVGGLLASRGNEPIGWKAFIGAPLLAGLALFVGFGLCGWGASGLIAGGPVFHFGITNVVSILIVVGWMLLGFTLTYLIARPELRERMRGSGDVDLKIATD